MKSKFINILKLSFGIILLILYLWIWINGLFIHRDTVAEIILDVPLLVIGAFMLLSWYKTSSLSKPTKPQRRKFILRVFLINYCILYIVYMISDIIYSDAINFLNLPGIILPVLLGLFAMGFILSWKNEKYAAFFFFAWYLLLVISSFTYSEIVNRGPYVVIGITILVQGILYATNPSDTYNKNL